MRLLIACAAAVAAVAFAAPSFAQEAAPVAPTAKKVTSTASCNKLKSTTAKTACLKRLHASAATYADVEQLIPHQDDMQSLIGSPAY